MLNFLKKNIHDVKIKIKTLSPAVLAGFWFTVCSVLQKGIQFLTTPIYTRVLTTSDYGNYSIFVTWQSIVTIVATMCLSYTQYYNGLLKYEDKKDQYTSVIQTLGSVSVLISTLIFTLLFPILESYIGIPYRIAVLMFLVAFFNQAFQFWSQQQRLYNKYRMLLALTIINSLVFPIIGVYLVVFRSMGYEGIVYGYVITNVLIGCVFYIKNIVKGRKLFSRIYWKYALRLSIPYIPHYLSQSILNISDRVMIKYYCGSSDAGIYSLAYQISHVITLLINGINASLTPWIYRCLSEKQYSKVKKATNQLVMLVGILSGGAMLIAPELIRIFGTKEYIQAEWVMPPVIFATFFLFVYSIWANVLFFFEENVKVAISSCLGALMNVALNVVFIPKFGFIAAAYTTVAGYIINGLSCLYFTKNVCRKKGIIITDIFDFKVSFLTIIALIIMIVIVLLLYKISFIVRYLILGITCICCIVKKDVIIDGIKEIGHS